MVTPKQILDFAEGLLSSPSEVRVRQAAARAYYSIFLLVRDELGVDTSSHGVGSHKTVKDAMLEELRVNTACAYLKKAAAIWDTLADDRIDADYKISLTFDTTRGRLAVARAKEVFNSYPN